jgi:dGTPase
MHSLRGFMFERVYLGPETRPQHAQAHATIRRIYEREQGRPDIVEFIAGMTDRFALSYAAGI